MIKVIILTVLFSAPETGTSVPSGIGAVVTYQYPNQKSCEVMRKFWSSHPYTKSAICTLAYQSKETQNEQ